jgi:PAS domain-containing protein
VPCCGRRGPNACSGEQLRRQRDSARRALHQTRAKLSALLDNPIYGVAHCDNEGRLLEGNLTLAAMLGCASRNELETAADCGPAPCPPWLAPAPSGRIAPVEMTWRRKDGSTVPVRCSGHEVRGAGRRAAGFLPPSRPAARRSERGCPAGGREMRLASVSS